MKKGRPGRGRSAACTPNSAACGAGFPTKKRACKPAKPLAHAVAEQHEQADREDRTQPSGAARPRSRSATPGSAATRPHPRLAACLPSHAPVGPENSGTSGAAQNGQVVPGWMEREALEGKAAEGEHRPDHRDAQLERTEPRQPLAVEITEQGLAPQGHESRSIAGRW